VSQKILYMVIPCYNEEEVLPHTSNLFLNKLKELFQKEIISEQSRILFVNDGSKDRTWEIIQELKEQDIHFSGISLSRNCGHQNALLAGLLTARLQADVTISLDCDGQDDIEVVDQMLEEYISGCDIVYGVRSKRESDTIFKRATAEGFYKIMKFLGADIVFNHADYRLMSKKALDGLAQYKEVNLFLRGIVPLIGYRYSSVYYERTERIAGKSHYPLRKMLSFAFDGITSLSVKPLRMISVLGFLTCMASLFGIIITVIQKICGVTVSGWSSMICILLLLGGIQLLSLGVIGEYIGKIYRETKGRPHYIISEKTKDF
jgi:Glycosyltransferases involved in cell wall biogenesis